MPSAGDVVSAADLIAMGIEVAADIDDSVRAEAYADLSLLIARPGLEPDAGVREVVRMLRDAADSAIDAHQDDPNATSIARVKRFSGLLTLALAEIS